MITESFDSRVLEYVGGRQEMLAGNRSEQRRRSVLRRRTKSGLGHPGEFDQGTETIDYAARMCLTPPRVLMLFFEEQFDRLSERLIEAASRRGQKVSRPALEHAADLGAPSHEQVGSSRIAHYLQTESVVRAFPRFDYHRIAQQPRQHGEVLDYSVSAEEQHRFADRIRQR